MAQFGGYGRERYGGSKPIVKTILQGLNAARGTAYNTETDQSPVYIENLAYARAIADVWDDAERFANQFDPTKMTVFLDRWEKILGLAPSPTDDDPTRRVAVNYAITRIGKPATLQEVIDTLNLFVGTSGVTIGINPVVLHTDMSVANTHWPDTGFADEYSSDVAHVDIIVTRPAGMTFAQFYKLAGKIMSVLEPIMPVWVTFDWILDSETFGLPGFYLDDTNDPTDPPIYNNNLDTERFDS